MSSPCGFDWVNFIVGESFALKGICLHFPKRTRRRSGAFRAARNADRYDFAVSLIFSFRIVGTQPRDAPKPGRGSFFFEFVVGTFSIDGSWFEGLGSLFLQV